MLYYEMQGVFHNHELGIVKERKRKTRGILWIMSE